MISLHYPVAMLLVALGIYALLFRRNLIKMVIGLEIITDGIHLFFISMGFRTGGISPILTGEFLNPLNIGEFASQAVDPLPQVLVLTSIVIDISLVALALSLTISLYRKHGTLNPFKIRRLRE